MMNDRLTILLFDKNEWVIVKDFFDMEIVIDFEKYSYWGRVLFSGYLVMLAREGEMNLIRKFKFHEKKRAKNK